jgi:hypothetical protein
VTWELGKCQIPQPQREEARPANPAPPHTPPSRKRYTQYVEHNRKGHCGNKSENRKGTNNGGGAVSCELGR